MKPTVLPFLVLASPALAAPGPFTPASVPYSAFATPAEGRAAWVDYDGDGDADISLHGRRGGIKVFELWLKSPAGLTLQTTNVTPESVPSETHGALAWADYNCDGRPDLLRLIQGPWCLSNICDDGQPTDGNMRGVRYQIWRNDGAGAFTLTRSGIGGASGDLEWTDADLNGYADPAASGYWMEYPGWMRTAYPLLLTTAAGVPQYGSQPYPLSEGTFAWLDYDRDGQTDLAFSGNQRTEFSYSHARTKLYRRTGDAVYSLTEQPLAATPYYNAEITWADIDQDGRPDLITNREGGYDLWRQTARGFTSMPNSLPSGVRTVWGDLDNDGDLDCAVCNSANASVWENTGAFTFTGAGIVLAAADRVSFADWDRDGDLDVLSGTGAVFINGSNTPAKPPVIRQIVPRPDSVIIAFQAQPAATLFVQSGGSGAGPWVTLTGRPLEVQPGEFTFVEHTVPESRRFYRLVKP